MCIMKNCSTFDTDDSRWDAVVNKDEAADGIFYFAVQTTGIFCRPSCSSRLPNRKNVSFFISCQEALKAGYRPCKKCRPTDKSKEEMIEGKIAQACRVMEKSSAMPKLADLAGEVGLSPYHFHRLFKKILGITPKQFSANIRARRFKSSLQSGQSVTEALYDAGYSSSSGIYNKKQDQLSMQPKEFRAGAADIDIQYGVAQCFLGWAIVAATDRGICAIELGDDPDLLPQQVQKKFPKARLRKASAEFTDLIKQVVDFINTPSTHFNLPLDIQGTAFQQQVWSILRQIKPGKTISYTELAEKLGNPKAIRAVAAANAANKLAVIIPCHRVIAKDGQLRGYRWGIERKRMLLENEAK